MNTIRLSRWNTTDWRWQYILHDTLSLTHSGHCYQTKFWDKPNFKTKMDMTYIYVAIGIAFVINIAGGRAIFVYSVFK